MAPKKLEPKKRLQQRDRDAIQAAAQKLRKRRNGPYKLDDATRKAFVAAAREGLFFPQCAALAGISHETAYQWINRGKLDLVDRDVDTPEAVFAREVDVALAQMQRERLRSIRQAEPGWQAHAWIIERRFQSLFGRRLFPENPEDLEQLLDQLCDVFPALPDTVGKQRFGAVAASWSAGRKPRRKKQ